MNRKQSRKALMWLAHKAREDSCAIIHGRNAREYRMPELPHLSVDGFCAETHKVYEFLGCYWHGHTCMPFRDTASITGETLADRYERTLARLKQLRQAGYEVVIEWECHFEKNILPQHPELEADPTIEHSPLKTRDALYGGRTEALHLHYKVREGTETIQYCDVMSLYPYICKYGKFPLGHPTIYVGEACSDHRAVLAMEGLIKCRILPPRRLYHPVLPYSCNERLFSACAGLAHPK